MASPNLEKKSFNSPDTTSTVANGTAAAVTLATGVTIQRVTLPPGWRWVQDVQPIAGTPSCPAEHTGVMLAGRLHFRMDDGTEAEFGPNDVLHVSPGHDVWVVGDEPAVMLDFTGGTAVQQYLQR